MAANHRANGFRSLQTTILAIGLTILLTLAVIISLVNYFQLKGLGKSVEVSIRSSVESDIEHITQSLVGQISAQDQALTQQLHDEMNMAKYLLEQNGGVSLQENQGSLTAKNQLTGESIMVALPVMQLGSIPIEQNEDPNRPSPIVDDIESISGDPATIYQVMNKAGDLLRVATNITQDGKRAVTTYIPSTEPGGAPNQVVVSIMKGEPYTGVSYVVNDWYLSVFEPLKDPKGKVIGAISIGVKQENNSILRNLVHELVVGETGHAFILGGRGERKGQFIIPPQDEQQGQSLLGTLDRDGLDIGEGIVNAATQLQPGEIGEFSYEPASESGKQLVWLAYYAPWDWIVGVSVPESEILSSVEKVKNGQDTIIWTEIWIAIAVTLVAGFIFSLLARMITKPIRTLQQKAGELSTGDLSVDMRMSDRNEIGLLSHSLHESVQFLQKMAAEAEKIASGDLTSSIQPRSEKDLLGVSFRQMIDNLNLQLRHVAANSQKLDEAAVTVAENASQAGTASSQIAQTIQQVAHGTSQQTESITRTAGSVEQLVRAIDGVAQGAQDQAQAVATAAEITNQISSTIQLVAERIKKAEQQSNESAAAATNGSAIVEETLEGMQIIKSKVEATDQKMKLMEAKSDQIDDIVATIEDIAGQTNLLALNAAIEAARAETQAAELIEFLLNRQMVSQAQLVNQLLAENDHRPEGFWAELAQKSGLDVISVANEDGVNVFSSDSRLVGFRYSEDPNEQSTAFRKIIHAKDGVVCQPPKKRNIDGLLYKYIGVSRKDRPGVIQVGFNAESLSQFKLQVGGFAVVANEVYRLAENSKTSAKNIAALIRDIRKSMGEAVKAMKESSTEVDNGYAKAVKANEALLTILTTAGEVSNQAAEAASAALAMNQYAEQLVMAVDSVSAVVEQNTAATEEMSASSNEVNQSIENIASVSEENSAAVEEVSASTEEVKAQVDLVTRAANDLQTMSESLKAVIAEFRLSSG